MNQELKTTIRDKVKSYIARAEELKKQNSPTPAPAAAATPVGNTNGNQHDPDLQQMMKRLEGLFQLILSIETHKNNSFDFRIDCC